LIFSLTPLRLAPILVFVGVIIDWPTDKDPLNPLPVFYPGFVEPGGDCSDLIGWGNDSHGRQRPAKECWGIFSQVARPWWFVGGFDEYGDFRWDSWWDFSRISWNYVYVAHREAHFAKGTIHDQAGDHPVAGLFFEADFRRIDRRPTWAWAQGTIVDGVFSPGGWPQRVGLFQGWEVSFACAGTQYLCYPTASIIPWLPLLPGLVFGGGTLVGGLGVSPVSDDAAAATMLKCLEVWGKASRRKRKI
jgi:hypothetical protein